MGQTGFHTYGPQIYPKKSATRDHSGTYQVSRNCSFISQWTWTTPLPSPGSRSIHFQVSWSCTRWSHGKIICAFQPCYSTVYKSHFRRWVAETIRLTYENSSESDLLKIKAHDVRVISASIAFYRNTPLKDLCGLISWKSSNVFVRQYGGRYGTTGHPSGGRTHGFPIIWGPIYSSLATSTNVA